MDFFGRFFGFLAVDNDAVEDCRLRCQSLHFVQTLAHATTAVCDKGDDGLAFEVVLLQKAHYGRSQGVDPVGRTNVDNFVVGYVLDGLFEFGTKAFLQLLFGLLDEGFVVFGVGLLRFYAEECASGTQ